MGKLRDLKDARDNMDWDDPDREEVEKKINDIEQWCIDNGNKYVTKLTTWRKGQGKKVIFGFNEDNGFETDSDGFILHKEEDKVITAHYRCGKCGNEVLHFILYNYCVVCDTDKIVVYVS